MKRILAAAALAAALPFAGSAQTGADVTKWVGASHDAYFSNAVEWARFQLLVTSDEFREIRQATEMNTRARVEGDHLILTGCLVRACTTTRAGLAVSVDAGKPLAVVWQRDREPKLYGAELDAMPPALRRLAESGEIE